MLFLIDAIYSLLKSRLLFLFFLGQPHCLGFVVEGVDAVDTALSIVILLYFPVSYLVLI